MKHLLTLLLSLGAIITQAQTMRVIATNDMTVREILRKNAYIEFNSKDTIESDSPFIVQENGTIAWDTSLGRPDPIEIFDAFDQINAFSKMRAARYRFHQKLVYDETGHISCLAQTAEELNMSEKLFNRFKKELENENKSLEHRKKNSTGGKVLVYGNNNYLDNLLEEPKDFSDLEIKDNGLTARDIIEKNVFISYTMEELNAKEFENEYEATINYVHPAHRAAMYRFYKNIKQDEHGICTWTIKRGAELNISEDLFNKFSNDLKSSNEFLLENMQKGIKATTTTYDEKYLNDLLDDEYAKVLLRRRQNVKYMPRYNRIEIK